MCKPHKMNGMNDPVIQEKKARAAEKDDAEDAEEYRTNPYYPFIGPQLEEA